MRISDTLRKNKKNFIIYGVLWLIMVIVFIMPIGVGITEATIDGKFDFGKCIEISYTYIQTPFSSFGKVFTEGYFETFVDILWKSTLAVILLAVIGTIRNASKSEYEDIEHGSSDWSKNGEQYRILSNKKGIILAEDHYLPVDKRGNINVLVVGRFRFW